jgi:2-methylcitrate dehydratase PrpD
VRPLAGQLGDWAAGLRTEDIPEPVVASAKDRVMDVLGICVAAIPVDAAVAVRALREESGAGRPQATFVGEEPKGSAAWAALVNGTYAHSLDFDDTHLPSIVHPSAPMVPAVLAQAEACGTTGAQALAALVVAYELNTRLSMAQYDPELGNSVFFEHGLHATSILGTVAAAAACARLRGLDAAGIANAIGIACSMGAGIIEANRAGGSVKKFHGGWAVPGPRWKAASGSSRPSAASAGGRRRSRSGWASAGTRRASSSSPIPATTSRTRWWTRPSHSSGTDFERSRSSM